MKVNRYGAVIIVDKDVRVEGWLVEREPSDPVDATPEQLLLEVAIPWAQNRMNAAILENMRYNRAVRNPIEPESV
jgi:hypothetical protein